jgi:uncharacterized protein (TIGR00156 family)
MRMLLYLLTIGFVPGAGGAGAGQDIVAPITTAASVASGNEDQPVLLRGKIVSRQSRNHYLFADESGSTLVKITRRMRNGAPLLPGMQVEIQGEVDTSANRPPRVEAKSVTVVTADNTWTTRPASPEPQPEPAKP